MSLITMNCTHVYTKGINSPQYCKLNNKLCIGDCNCKNKVIKYVTKHVLDDVVEDIRKLRIEENDIDYKIDRIVDILAELTSYLKYR
jgi:hypothetical protein